MHIPRFQREVVADGLTDGYWIQAVDLDGSGRPGLLTSGLTQGVVRWYANPGWTPHTLAELTQPVAWAAADITGTGTLDLVVCHDYGESMYAHKPDDGTISWLRNPGTVDGPWEVRRIGNLVSAHRLRLGHFTDPRRLQLLALPVVSGRGGRDGMAHPAAVTVLDRPDDVLAAPGWPVRTVDDSSFGILHDYTPAGPDASGLETFVVASREGLSSYGWDSSAAAWTARRFGAGESGQEAVTGFRGSSSVALGRLPAQGTRYAATVEPFHGNTVAVYAEPAGPGPWHRTVLDVFGDPNSAGEGPGHHVVAADFDGDGEDEFLVALRGPMPWQGVFYYKAVDAAAGLWVKRRVSEDSAARIAVADFNGDGTLDFATIGYYTPGYFLADNPVVAVHRNSGP